MKIRFLFLLSLAIMPSYLCFGQDKEVEVRLSLVDKHVKMELTNHTDEDLYIPHLSAFFTIWDKNGVDVTNAYRSHLQYAHSDFVGSNPFFGLPAKEFRDENYSTQQQIYENEALKKEIDIFLKLNPSITEKKIQEKFRLSFDDFGGLLYMYTKYDGIAIKAGQTLNVFEPIFGLFENNGRGNPRERLTIRFSRHRDLLSSVFETVKYDDYRIYTTLPEMNAGYRLYDGAIDCDDVITLNP